MNYRRLGNTEIFVSEIGFGAWGIGGVTPGPTSYGPTDDETSILALSCAFEKGVTFYDTSNVYGAGHSEILIGKTFKNFRDRVTFATKAGLPEYGQAPDFSADGIKQSLEGSLKRLQTDYVDLLFFHNPESKNMAQNEEIMGLVDQWLQQGTVRSFGVSVRNPQDGLDALVHMKPDAIQTNFNLMDRRAIDSGLFERVEKSGTSIIARTPLSFGFLSGTIDINTQFSEQDHRSRWPEKQIAAWVEGARQLLACKEGAAGQTNTQFALRFCLSFPQVAATIPGMLTSKEVIENVKASERGSLGLTELENVERVYVNNNGFIDGQSMQTAQKEDPGKIKT